MTCSREKDLLVVEFEDGGHNFTAGQAGAQHAAPLHEGRRWQLLLEAGAGPVGAGGGGFEGAAGGVGDGGGVGVDGEDREQVDVGGRRELLPGGAAVDGAEDGAVAADEPADLTGVSGARDEIGDDAARLNGPSGAGIGGALDHTSLTDAPNRCAVGSGNAQRSDGGGDAAVCRLG